MTFDPSIVRQTRLNLTQKLRREEGKEVEREDRKEGGRGRLTPGWTLRGQHGCQVTSGFSWPPSLVSSRRLSSFPPSFLSFPLIRFLLVLRAQWFGVGGVTCSTLTFKSSGGLRSMWRRVSELACAPLSRPLFSLSHLLSGRWAAAFHHVFVLHSPVSPSLSPSAATTSFS